MAVDVVVVVVVDVVVGGGAGRVAVLSSGQNLTFAHPSKVDHFCLCWPRFDHCFDHCVASCRSLPPGIRGLVAVVVFVAAVACLRSRYLVWQHLGSAGADVENSIPLASWQSSCPGFAATCRRSRFAGV